ncbi:hypothetical protein ACIBCT_20720 [Streptosporangium sp. NPDC050855]|uniref:hypothetical protein n=1 Tax=Streptosporangium sp. NPDC050855 TaxID=3366194 RepID=UPI0037A9ADAB
MSILTVLPNTVTWPQGAAHLPSSDVAALLGVQTRRVTGWQKLGLITASAVTGAGRYLFLADDVQAFLRETTFARYLHCRDIVACRAWNDGRPVRVLHATPVGRDGLYIRWQDVAVRAHAMDVLVGHNRLVRRLHQEAA